MISETGVVLQSVPWDFILKVVEQEATVEDSSQLIFKDQPGGVFAGMLKEI
jgi:hypothetical protein